MVERGEAARAHLVALDGLRGIAAVAVVLYHSRLGDRFGLFGQGWLAVDFFLCLSGYVIGLAYDKRLARGMSASAFAAARVVRLYPMVLIGGLIGIALLPLNPQVPFCLDRFPGSPAVAAVAQLAMVPAVTGACVYAYNNVFWSLFFELIANALHFAVLWACPTRLLCLVTAALAVLLVGLALAEGNMAFGALPVLFWRGVARCLLSYTIGYTLFRTRHRWLPLLPVLPFNLVALALLLVLMAPPIVGVPGAGLGENLAMVLAVFPLIVALGVRSRISGRWPTMLGAASYPLYAIHLPIVLTIGSQFLHWPAAAFIAVRLGGIAGVIALAWLLAVTVDLPLNRWRRRPAPALATA